MAEAVLDPWPDHAGEGWLSRDKSADELTFMLKHAGRRTRAVGAEG
jgi:hypothetical protein